MKKIIILLLCVIALSNCKKDSKQKTTKNTEALEEKTISLPTYKGDFLYIADGAVLKVENKTYNVASNDILQKLIAQVAVIKKGDYDMVPVIVKGIVSKKDKEEEGWDEIITIKEIVKVNNVPSKVKTK